MVAPIKATDTQKHSSTLTEGQAKKHLKLIETTYHSNTSSDYTEKIEELYKNFNYSSNSNHYWSEPEQSLLYGTPLYESASPAQKLALNHLHWFAFYNFVAASETETITYNQITASVFSACGYETLSRELALETSQERTHINAFHKIGYMTMKALLGQEAFKAPLKGKLYQVTNKGGAENSLFAVYQYKALRFIVKTMLNSKKQYYSQYLRELEETNEFIIPTSTTGVVRQGLSTKSLQRFFTFNWGGSPLLASHYYAAVRIMANMLLKNTEHNISKYFRNLENKGEPIPAPTAVSHYHFLDESFHTTTSLVIARDLYKNFPKPTAYEKFVANLGNYLMQRGMLSGLSAISPSRYYADDCSWMYFVYRILKSPLFGMSAPEALHSMEKCFCQEHEGFHVTAKYHQRLLSDLRRFYDDLDYLWPINREMRLMASGGSISKAIQSNIKTFKEFSRLMADENR